MSPRAEQEHDAISDEKRIELIKRALKDCGQDITLEIVEKMFRYETGRALPK